MAKIADLEVVVGSDISGAERGLDKVDGKVGGLSKAFKVATGVIVGGGVAIAGGLTGAIMTAASFEEQMSAVASVSGATSEEFKLLEQEALRIGSSTSLSATEAAQAMEIMAKAGVPLSDILNGATEDAVNLANATGTDIVLSSETAAAAMNQFGVSSEEAADIIARSANASALDVNDWALALKTAGPVAASLGVPMEDLGAAMMILADNGIKGEVAATALRNTLMNLSNPSDQVASALNDLGVSSTYANGQFKGMDQIMQEMMPTWSGLTDQQKMFYAEQIAGKDGAAAFLTLMNEQEKSLENGTSAFEARKAAMEGVGTAEEQAAQRMDNFNGSLEEFKGALETAAIIIGGMFLPYLRNIVDAGTDLIAWFLQAQAAGTLFSDIMAALPAPLASVVGAIVSFGRQAGSIISRLIDNFNVFRGMDYGIVTAGLRAIGVVFPDLYGHVLTAIDVWNSFKAALATAAGILIDVGSAVASFVMNALQMGAVRDILVGVVAGFVAFKGIMGIVGVFKSIQAAVIGLRGAMIALNTSILANPFVLAAAAIIGLGVALYLLYQRFEGVRNVVDPVIGVIKDLAKWVGGKAVDGFNKLMKVLKPVPKALSEGWDKAVAIITRVADIVGGALVSAFNTLMGWLRQGASAITDFASRFGFLDAAARGVQSILSSLQNIFNNLVSAARNLGEAFSALMSGDLSGFFSNLGQAGLDLIQGVIEYATMMPKAILEAFRAVDWSGAISEVLDLIVSGISAGAGAMGNLWGWLTDSLQSAFSSMRTALGNAIQLAWNAITSINWSDFVPRLVWDFFVTAVDLARRVGAFAWDVFVTAVDLTKKVGRLLWSAFVTAVDLAVKVGEFAWDTFVTAVDLAAKVGDFAWDVFVTAVDLAAKVGDFAWSTFVTAVDLAAKVGDFAWSTFVTAVDLAAKVGDFAWSTFVTAVDLSKKVGSLLWSSFVTAVDLGKKVAALAWSSFVTGVDFIKDLLVSALSWADFIPDIDWGSLIPDINWSDFIPDIEWPSPTDILKAIGDRINPFGGAEQDPEGNTQAGQDVNNYNQPPPEEWNNRGFTGSPVQLSFTFGGSGGGTPYSSITAALMGAAQDAQAKVETTFSGLNTSVTTFVGDTIALLGGWLTGVQTMMSTFSSSFHPPISQGTSAGKQSFITFVGDTIAVMGGWISGITTMMSTFASSFHPPISQGTSAGKQSFITFVGDSIAVMGGWSSGLSTNVTTTMSTFKTQISSGTSAGKQSHITFVSDTIAVMGGWASGVKTNVTNTMSTFKTQISTGTSQGKQSFITFGNDARSAVSTAMSNIRSAVNTGMNNVVSAIRNGMRDATSAIRNGASDWSGIIRGFSGSMRSAGSAVGAAAGEGVAAGLRGAIGSVRAAANEIISEVDRAMRAKARIKSPSRMTTYFGEMIGAGLVVGMNDMIRDVSRASDQLAMASLTQSQGVFSGDYSMRGAMVTQPITTNNTYHVTINNTVQVDDLDELNDAVEFVRDLDRERELIFTGSF